MVLWAEGPTEAKAWRFEGTEFSWVLVRGCVFKDPRSWALRPRAALCPRKLAPWQWEGAASGVRGGAGPLGCVGSGGACLCKVPGTAQL